MRQSLLALAALGLMAWALWVLECARGDLRFEALHVGPTPVTYLHGAPDGPAIVVAHGFAGSRQMMLAYGQTLARAGYNVYLFDFEGHGRHPQPMSGDLTAIDGTTRLLVAQTLTVLEHAADRHGAPVALLGHSMATDILVRVAIEADAVGPLVLLSAFSNAITTDAPASLLLIAGAWESGLAGFAQDAVRMVDTAADFGQTVSQGGVTRRAILAPWSEHVSILHSREGQRAALAWMNDHFERGGTAAVPPTGWALLALLAAITALSPVVARLVPRGAAPPAPLRATELATATILPALAAPLLAALPDTRLLPVLVADYLALHLALYGLVQLVLLWRRRPRPARPSLRAAALLLVWALGVFGFALDRYGANFWPTPDRLWIIAALAIGAVPFMLADAWLAHGAPLWHRLCARLAFIASLGIAVALDFEGLFFLLMIAPVIILFWLTMGVMGRAFSARSGPLTAGLALGLVLAWALGVSFPLIAA